MASAAEFDVLFARYQAEQALSMDRMAKAVAVVVWLAVACKHLAHRLWWEAALSLSCPLVAALLLAASCWRRARYLRYSSWLTAGAILQAHAVGAAVCVQGSKILAGRHSSNVLRFAVLTIMSNLGLFQAFAALNSWPMLGMRFIVPVQLASVALMMPRQLGMCQVVLENDAGAARLFAGANWLLRQAFTLMDTGPAWEPSSSAQQEAECLQVNLWWLLLCGVASIYVCWLREQCARERFARQLGAAGVPHLHRLLHRHPMYSHQRPALLIAIELYAMAAVIFEGLRAVLPRAMAAGWLGGRQLP